MNASAQADARIPSGATMFSGIGRQLAIVHSKES